MYSLGKAYKSKTLDHKLQATKILHSWLNTGNQQQKIDPKSNGNCPCCNSPIETQAHVMQCKDPRMKAARYNATTDLVAKIGTKFGISKTWTTLHQRISHWLQQIQFSQPSSLVSQHALHLLGQGPPS